MRELYLFICLGLLFGVPLKVEAQQKVASTLRKGHKAIRKGEYSSAEAAYRRALAQDSTLSMTHYSLGNVLYKQKKYKEALEAYSRVDVEKLEDPMRASQLFHNVGNVQLQQKQYAQAAESYKQALRLNPTDDETRYNLALALKQIPPEQKNQGGGSTNQPQPQPRKQEQQPPKEDKKEQRKPENPKSSEKIDPKTAEKILDAYQQDEDESRRNYEARRQQDRQQRQDKNKKRW